MASVTSSTLRLEGDLASEFNMDRSRQYQLEFYVKTNGIMGPVGLYTGALVASPHPIYDIWDTYGTSGSPVPILAEYDEDAYCNKITTKKIDPKQHLVTCHFGTLPRGRDPGEANPNPLLRPVRYRGAKLVKTRAVTVDNTGKPITTSAKEEFDEPLEEDVAYPILVATRNVLTLNNWLADLANFYNSVNSGAYRGETARKWWCIDIEVSDLINEQGYEYYQETWHLGWSHETWDEKILDRGWKILEGEGAEQKQVNAKDSDGADLTAPILLDGSGHKLAVTADPIYRTFKIRREVNWSSIPV
jgi:hypothetical protein